MNVTDKDKDRDATVEMDAVTLAELRSLSSIPPCGAHRPVKIPTSPRAPAERVTPEPPEAA